MQQSTKLTTRDYQDAIDSQTASNAMALINNLCRIIPAIRMDCIVKSICFENHPIYTLYATQIHHLASTYQKDIASFTDAWTKAYDEAEKVIKQGVDNLEPN